MSVSAGARPRGDWLPAAVTRDAKGAGLGLDVVQRVIRSHGGTVELSSQPRRTEFRVTLPVAAG